MHIEFNLFSKFFDMLLNTNKRLTQDKDDISTKCRIYTTNKKETYPNLKSI